MTNRKIRDYHKNKLTYDILLDNFKMLCIILLCLNKHFPKKFYQLNVQKWLEEYAEWCSLMNEYEEDDAYDFKMEEFSRKCGIDDDIALKIVTKHLGSYCPQNMKVLSENVKLAFVHTVTDFGFGAKRLKVLTEALLQEEYPKWREEINEFGIDVDAELKDVDYRKLQMKKKKAPSLEEKRKAAQDLAEYRAYFDSIVSQE